MRTEARQKLGTFFRESGGEEENRPQIALASDEDRAIDLSCRACGALALGAGLGFPVGASAPLRFAPPTSDWKVTLNRSGKAGLGYSSLAGLAGCTGWLVGRWPASWAGWLAG